MENGSYAQQLALSKSVQGVVRALGVFARKFPGKSIVRIENHEDGAIVEFGASNLDCHDEFAKILGSIDRLIYLEQSIELLRDIKANPIIIEKMIEEALLIGKLMYPDLKNEIEESEKKK